MRQLARDARVVAVDLAASSPTISAISTDPQIITRDRQSRVHLVSAGRPGPRNCSRRASCWRSMRCSGFTTFLYRKLYMRPRESRGFSRSTFLLFLRFKRRSSALMARQTPLLGCAERSTPQSPQGRAGRREGLTAKARDEQQCSSGQYAANVTAFSVDPSFSVDVPITFVQLTPRRSPFRYAALAASPYIRSGRSPVPRSLAVVRGHRAPR